MATLQYKCKRVRDPRGQQKEDNKLRYLWQEVERKFQRERRDARREYRGQNIGICA